MCGRQACTLAPDQVSKSCQFRDKNGNLRQPQWVHLPGTTGKYVPSPNIGPKTATPILLSKKKVAGVGAVECKEDRVLCEMQWGLVPSWHKGSMEDFKFNMINCRSDTILDKASFRGPLERGQRCVAVAEGFFEWKTAKDGKKQPYFIQFKEDLPDTKVDVKVELGSEDNSSANITGCEVEKEVKAEFKTENDESNGGSLKEKKLVYMAALYDTWKAARDIEPLYSYTIITVDSASSLHWLHDRMPAILETEEQVRKWLDVGDIPKKEALKLLKPADCLTWYPVSTVVNNVRNKSLDCMKEIDLSAKATPKTGSSNLMSFWLKKSPKKHERDTDNVVPPETKKFKSIH